MKKKIELLAPGGDINAIKAAIAAGADAVYLGLNKFNARNRAANIDFEDLYGILNLAHDHQCKIFLTLNILIVDSEFPYLTRLLNKLANMDIDGIIVQDLGLFHLLSTYFKNLRLHASTQLNTHNPGQIKFLKALTATRVNLPREMSLDEIRALAKTGHDNHIKTEVFVHGSYCLSFSGLCYISSVHSGKSGNRGQCSQPCRDPYQTTARGKKFPLNLKDNSAYSDIKLLSEAGVDSLKIEGRIKDIDYVYTVVKCFRKQLCRLYENCTISSDKKDLYKVFNRDFSNAYLTGVIHENMFIDNPRDHSIRQFAKTGDSGLSKQLQLDKINYYREKEDIFTTVRNIIKDLSADKIPVQLEASGHAGAPLRLCIKTPDHSFVIESSTCLAPKTTARGIDHDILSKRVGTLEDSKYIINEIKTKRLEKDLYLSFKALGHLKKELLSGLNRSQDPIAPVETPFLEKQPLLKTRPKLCVLVSDQEDLALCRNLCGDIYFQLPNCSENQYTEFIDLFTENKELIPWFPAVLISSHYQAAVRFLETISPRPIVTNNSGIAYQACKKDIPWVAGPYMNSVNSFSLLALKEHFNCQGAFLSNEINQKQLKRIIRPEGFDLYYSIFHPILLMNSRQCLFHQVTGCKKDHIDMACIYHCSTSAMITNKKNVPLILDKQKGNYHCMYHHAHFLNTDIIKDIPGTFSGLLVDIRNVPTQTRVSAERSELISLFQALVSGDPDAKALLDKNIFPFSKTQYKKGI